MKYYAEIIEELTEEEMLERQPQMVRIEVRDEAEALAVIKKYEPYFAGRKYRKQLHIHHHGEGRSCEVKPL